MPAVLQIQIVGQDESAGAFASLEGNLSKISPASEVAVGALRHVGEIAVDALGQAAGAAVGFAKDSIAAAGDFEQGLAGFANATGKTLQDSGKSLDDFKNLFISLGAELPVSTKEVEEAAIAMAQGGIDPATIAAGGLKDTIQFASAAMKGDLVGAAEISAKTMAAWTDINADAATKTEFMAHAQNLMTQATTAASTTVDQLFLGLSNVGGTARLAGLSFDETTTALAQLTPAFSSSADAGTSFKTFLARLQPETKPAIAAMTELGLYTKESGSAFYDANGKFVGMAEAERLLHEATKDLTDAQRQQYLQTIFGNDAIRAAGVFANQGADGYDALATSISKQSTVQEAAARNQATFNTALDNFKGSIEAVQITIGSALLPVLTQLFNGTLAPAVNTVRDIVNALLGSKEAFASLPPAIQPIVATVQQAVAAFGTGGLAGALGVLIPGFSAWLPWLQQAWTALQPLVSVIQANLVPILITLGGVLAGTVVVAIAGAVGAFLSVAAPIAGMIALGATLVAAWQSNFAGVQTVVTSVLGAIWAVVSAVVGQIAAFWQANGSQILAFAATTWSQIQQIIATALQLIMGILVPILTEMASAISAHSALIQELLGLAWSVISTVISTALAVIQGVLQTALQLIQGDWKGAWETIQSLCASIVEGIVGVIAGAAVLLADAVKLNIDAMVGQWKAFTGWAGIGGGVIDGIISGVAGGVGKLVDAVKSAAERALKAAKSFLGIASPSKLAHDELGVPIPEGMATGVTAASPKVEAALVDLASKVISIIDGGVGAFAKLATYEAPSRDAVSRFGQTLAEVIGNLNVVAEWFTTKAMSASAKFVESATKILSLISSGVDALTKLAHLAAPSRDAISLFGTALAEVVGNLNVVADWFHGQGFEAAVLFAASAGKIIGVIGVAVDAMAKLATFTSVPDTVFEPFAYAIQAVVVQLWLVAGAMSTEAPRAAAVFASSAGQVLQIIGGGVDGLTKLATFAGVPDAAFESFAYAVQAIVVQLWLVAGTMEHDAVTAAGVFASGAGQVFQVLGGGVDGLTKLATFTGVPEAAIAAFGAAVQATVAALVVVTQQFQAEAVAAAAVFASDAGKVLALISSGIDGLVKLADFQGVGDAKIAALQDTLSRIVSAIVALSTSFSADAVAAAAAFAETVSKIVTLVAQAVDAFAKLGDVQKVSNGVVDAFKTSLAQLLDQFRTLAVPAATDLGTVLMQAMAQGIASGTTVVSQALGAVSQAMAQQAVETVAASVLSGIGLGSAVGGVTTSSGGAPSNVTHQYYITGYNAGQATDLTTQIRQTQLLQSALA